MISYDLDIGESAQRTELILATVGTVSAEGTTLIFDGTDTPTTKRYKKATGQALSAGTRVLVAKISGTYIIVAPIRE